MSRPAGGKSSLTTEHPAAPPAAREERPAVVVKKPQPSRTKISFYTSQETAGQVRAALAHVPVAVHGYRNVSDLIDAAVTEKLQQLQQQHNKGEPWPAMEPGSVSRGRPLE